MKKPRPGLVDKALQSLDTEQQAKWQNLVRFNASYSQLINFLKESNATGADRLCSEHLSNWWANNRPRGTEAMVAIAYAEQFQGQVPRNLLEMSVGITAKMVQCLLDNFDIDKATNASKLYSLIELLKELRQSSSELIKISNNEDGIALKFEGASQLAQFLKQTYKDTSFEHSLDSAIQEHFKTYNGH